jgi:hydroxyacid-oxoacid transhydrogenase
VFQFTTPSSPDRHREASALFNQYKPDNVDDSKVSDEDVGKLLYDRIARFLADLDMPRGIGALGYVACIRKILAVFEYAAYV